MIELDFRPHARTIHEIYQEDFVAKGLNRNYLWSLIWENKIFAELALYESLRWHLIAINKGSKRPIAETKWSTEDGLDKKRAWDFCQQGFNLAVVAGYSDLAILDYDSKDIPDELARIVPLTLTARTPRGFAFFTTKPFAGRNANANWGPLSDKKYEEMQSRFPGFDKSPRVNVLYELLPLSKTCTQDFGTTLHEHDCSIHDYRIREWIGPARRPMAFKDFVNALG